MDINYSKYKTIIFDCDGVIFNSNQIKTEAFYQVALPYGEKNAQILVDYHLSRGGISRYEKFIWFIEQILKDSTVSLDKLLMAYANVVKKALLSCEIAEGLQELKEQTKQANWLIVSGGDQTELREIFAMRDLDKLFDGGIFGSPDDKKLILSRELKRDNIKKPSLFLGDSRYDFESAQYAGLDFIFLSKWTEFNDWQNFQQQYQFKVYEDIKSLVELSNV